MPPAFNLGILNNIDKAAAELDAFMKNLGVEKTNSELRSLVAECREEEIAPRFILDELCVKMIDIAREGLAKRNKGEEILLA